MLGDLRQNAFVGATVLQLSGPDAFRYPAARALVTLDALLCRMRLVKGFERILIARKRP